MNRIEDSRQPAQPRESADAMTESLEPQQTPSEAPESDQATPEAAPEPEAAPAPEAAIEAAPSEWSQVHATLAHLVIESEKHHHRAAHRESVIDNLHAELEKLRTGERRGVVRPLLVTVARLRDDLVRQAAGLPEDFDAPRARRLLDSFADSIEITLEDYGVATFSPSVGDDFEARRHRAVASQPTSDPALQRTIAGVQKDGYHDLEAGVVLTQAEVTVFVPEPIPVPEPTPQNGLEDPDPATTDYRTAPTTTDPEN